MSPEDNATEISFSKSIYEHSAILSAIQAYEAYAKFDYTEHEYDVKLTIEPKQKQHAQLIIDSFCNHVLFESINVHRNEKGGTL